MARPQPVTATVTKPEWMKVQGTRYRTHSFDSTGSTASLVSVLDHDSYVESDSEKQEVVSPKSYNDQQQEVQNTSFENYTQSEYSKEESMNVERSHPQESFTDNSCSHVNQKFISPWEKWLIEKEKRKREQLHKERARKTLENVTQIDMEHMKQQKKIKESENTFRWIQGKNLAEKLRMQQERERLKAEMQEEARKKLEMSEKAKKTFTTWLQKKKEEEKAAKMAEAEHKKEEEEKKKKKQALAEEKYNEWYKRAMKTQVKPATNGMGYLSGKLTDYHDRTAYPPPSFYNPIPWKPLAIPKPKMEKRPKTSNSCTGFKRRK